MFKPPSSLFPCLWKQHTIWGVPNNALQRDSGVRGVLFSPLDPSHRRPNCRLYEFPARRDAEALRTGNLWKGIRMKKFYVNDGALPSMVSLYRANLK